LQSATRLFEDLQAADAAPTAQIKTAVADLQTKVDPMLELWKKLLAVDLPALNQQLKQAGFPEVTE
jgi:hypothetical protein